MIDGLVGAGVGEFKDFGSNSVTRGWTFGTKQSYPKILGSTENNGLDGNRTLYELLPSSTEEDMRSTRKKIVERA